MTRENGVRVKLHRDLALVGSVGEGHNRWHPDVPALCEIEPGQIVTADIRDGFDGQLTPRSDDQSIRQMDMKRGHPLTGPFFIRGAEPGDVLEVELLEVVPDSVGATCIIPGFGLLADEFQSPYLVMWKITDGVARSNRLPGIAIRGAPFVGLLGVAPSAERLRQFAEREAALAERGGKVLLPDAGSAVPADGPPAIEGLRTIPPRENGGNMDIKQATAGARVSLIVDVPGALLSLGDIHFAQGDGESCGVAIEVAGVVTFRTNLQKAYDVRWQPRFPVLEYVEKRDGPPSRRVVTTTGLPLNERGDNHELDVYECAKNAVREMISHLTTLYDLTPEQAYIIISVAADLHISSIVNTPNPVVSAVLALDIFEDQRP